MEGKQKRVRYSTEFKNSSIQLWLSGRSKASVCKELGICAGSLDLWIKQAGVPPTRGTLPVQDVTTLGAEELIKVNREQAKRIRRLELEKEILEKAAAFFAAKQLP